MYKPKCDYGCHSHKGKEKPVAFIHMKEKFAIIPVLTFMKFTVSSKQLSTI